MEPVKGGNLVNLPDEAKEIIDSLGGGSPASYAIRFAAGFDGVFMVLSGMSDMKQMEDNVSHMKEFKPLDGREREALDRYGRSFSRSTSYPAPPAATAPTAARSI